MHIPNLHNHLLAGGAQARPGIEVVLDLVHLPGTVTAAAHCRSLALPQQGDPAQHLLTVTKRAHGMAAEFIKKQAHVSGFENGILQIVVGV
jgi:hypothetical protein